MFDPPTRPPATAGRRGVTLIEVMTILVIIGILTGLAYIKYDSFQRQAELRSSAQKLFQILSWARLESEKRGDTLLVKFSFPEISVYPDINGNGIVDNGESRILMDSLARSVRLFAPAATPTPAVATAPTNGLADGAGICGTPGVCCDNKRTSSPPTWNVPASPSSGVAICARNMPRMPSVMEEGAVYLESSLTKIPEKWAVVMASRSSANPTLWTATKTPAVRTDWTQRR